MAYGINGSKELLITSWTSVNWARKRHVAAEFGLACWAPSDYCFDDLRASTWRGVGARSVPPVPRSELMIGAGTVT